jgi:nitrate/TMAO reductase-like tetraheme cytochrome c subunit
MAKIISWFKRFLFPPEGSPLWLKILPYAVLGILTLMLFVGGAYGWDYTNSPEFCGTSCHSMPPEYTAYLTSPHARVDCVECHIGRDFIATRITRKAGDARHIIATAFQTYEFPIRAKTMRPARETCERCHFPEKFSNDSLVEIKQFDNNLDNTPTSIFLVMKIGGGSQREGLGRGIHWHIENQVLYYPLDPLEQVIPYVQVTSPNGQITEFVDLESGFDSSQIEPADLKEMDCITCHNRITHMIFTPQDTVDQLLAQRMISPDIPEIRLKAVEVYSQIYDSTQMGLNGIAGLEAYYQLYYPDFYASRGEDIRAAIAALQDAYSQSVFPEQKADWTTHPNNVGHKDSPGCFRCHGGKHLDDQQNAVRLECNLCHSIPVVAGEADFVANIEISRGPEPRSHLNPNWISLHNAAFDDTCANCHTVANPGGTDNISFCSNSACHGNVWEYAGFDAPALREVLLSQLPATATPMPTLSPDILTFEQGIGALFQARCGSCHGSTANLQGLDLTSYETMLEGGASGAAIVPNDPDSSLVIQYMLADRPHFSQFSPHELEQVINWINEGAPER